MSEAFMAWSWVLPVIAAAALAGGCKDTSAEEDQAGATAPVARVETVRVYPHDPTAFTQGLVFHDGVLYESTGRYNESTLRRVELQTGKVLQKVDVPPQHFAEGLALLGGKLYQLTWQDKVGFVYDLATLQQSGTFGYAGEGWGLTTDGTSLIMSDGSNQLRFLDPQTYQVTRTVDVRDGDEFIQQINELEWVRGEIWANVWHSDRIARINPQTGQVVGWLDLADLYPEAQRTDGEAVLNGIAYDPQGDRLFVTGKLWPALYEIRVPGRIASGRAPAPG